MAQQNLNLGVAPNDNTGDALRVAFQKIQDNLTELYDVASSLDTGIASGLLSSDPEAGVGYVTGSGGSVVQTSAKNAAVTLNKITGTIQMAANALAAGVGVAFKLNNTAIAASDSIVVQPVSGFSSIGSYRAQAEAIAAGSVWIYVTNQSAGSLSEPVTLKFTVIKAANA